jgi:hypothetical protein
MTDQPTGYIRVQIDMQYDARSQGFFAKAPANWADMEAAEREQFLDNAAQQFLDEQIECHATFYATADEASAANPRGWGPQFNEHDVEDIY